MEPWQKEIFERLASMERSVKYIEANMQNLPQSPQCIREFEEVTKRLENLEAFKTEMLKRIAWVSGAFAIIASGFFQFFDQIKAFFRTN
jgi:hypothetical protein